MKVKKVQPVLLLMLMAVIALTINRYKSTTESPVLPEKNTSANSQANNREHSKFDRRATNLFFTKHARCRMKCRHITQQEVKDILVKGRINYNKSDLNDPSGPAYAVEGMTKDRQKVRIIFAPKQQHLTVVTVIVLSRNTDVIATNLKLLTLQ